MGKVIFGLLTGVALCVLAVAALFVIVMNSFAGGVDDVNQRLGITVEPVTVPVIVNTVQPYATRLADPPPLPDVSKPDLGGASGSGPVKRDALTDEIKETFGTSGGRNK